MQLHCFTGEMWAQRCWRRATPPTFPCFLALHGFAPPLYTLSTLLLTILFSGLSLAFIDRFSENFPPHPLSIKHLHINPLALSPAEHLSTPSHLYIIQSLALALLGVFRKFCPVCNLFKPSAIPLQFFQWKHMFFTIFSSNCNAFWKYYIILTHFLTIERTKDWLN